MTTWFVDTSVAIPLVLTSHSAHTRCNEVVGQRTVQLAAHALLETYSVLTRLPGDARIAPNDAAILLEERFGKVAVLSAKSCRALVPMLARQQIAGGAVYDALIATTVMDARGMLLTRDRRAITTYALMGVPVEVLD
jgi:toxin FitB